MRRALLPLGRPRFATTLVALWFGGVAPAVSQAQPRGGRGYLFEAPRGSVTLRLGASSPQAAGSVFDFVSRQLTVDRGDYRGAAIAADINIAHSPRIETLLSFASASRRVGSEYRNFVDNDDQPIEQATSFRRTPLTAGVRLNLVSSGRRVGRLAWVPTAVVPWVAAGGGVTNYRFQQNGDFIDFRTNDVFTSTLTSSGWAPTAFGAAGVSWRVRPSIALLSELRYEMAHAPLSRDFDGFDRIDLSALGVTAGLQFHF